MSIISANTLFHFTRTQDTLLKILEFGFRPKYCCEFGLLAGNKPKESHIPMICFCDLPLSSIEKHSKGHEWTYKGEKHQFDGYGNFGLGLSKSWGIKQRLNPVTYINNESHLLNYSLDLNEGSSNIMREFHEKNSAGGVISESDIRKTPPNIMNTIYRMSGSALNIFSYMKPYENLITGQRYYDEREWRFVIPFNIDNPNYIFHPVLTHILDDAEAEVTELQNIINNDDRLRLAFSPNDIKYIIVERDEDIKEVKGKLISLPGKYTSEEIERLTSRIITLEQIHEDF